MAKVKSHFWMGQYSLLRQKLLEQYVLRHVNALWLFHAHYDPLGYAPKCIKKGHNLGLWQLWGNEADTKSKQHYTFTLIMFNKCQYILEQIILPTHNTWKNKLWSSLNLWYWTWILFNIQTKNIYESPWIWPGEFPYIIVQNQHST